MDYNLKKYNNEIQLLKNFDIIYKYQKNLSSEDKVNLNILENCIDCYCNIATQKESFDINDVIRKDITYFIYEDDPTGFKGYIKSTNDKNCLCLIIFKTIKDEFKIEEIERYYFLKNKKIFMLADNKTKEVTAASVESKYWGRLRILNKNDELYEISNIFSLLYPYFNGEIHVIKGINDLLYYIKSSVNKKNNVSKKAKKCLSHDIGPFIKPDNFDKSAIEYDIDGKANISYIHKINDSLACIRTATVYYLKDKEFILEKERCYIKKNKYLCCCLYSSEEFNLKNFKFYSIMSTADYFYCKEEDFLNSPISHLWPILKNFNYKNMFYALKLFIQDSFMEKLYKTGFSNMITLFINMYKDKAYKNICECFSLNKRRKEYNQIFGLNKYQIKKISLYFEEKIKEFDLDVSNPFTEKELNEHKDKITKKQIVLNSFSNIRFIKKILYKKDIRNIDNKTFDILFDFTKINPILIESYYESLRLINKIYGLNSTLYMSKKLFDLSLIDSSDCRYGKCYLKYLKMADEFNLSEVYGPKFKNIEDIKKMYDEMLIVYNNKKDKDEKERFWNTIKKCEKYKYENDKYIIVFPKEPLDIVKEAEELIHCGRSFIPCIIKGETNLLFIRKKEDVDKSFYTVKISNDGIIEQVHGYQNCNADKVEDLPKFIKDWSDNCSLIIGDYNSLEVYYYY